MTDNKIPTSPVLILTTGLCIGHVNTALFFLSTDNPAADDPFCVPLNVTVLQFLGVLNKYMREHPEIRNEPFNVIILESCCNCLALRQDVIRTARAAGNRMRE